MVAKRKPVSRTVGPVGKSVRAHVAGLRSDGLDTGGEALAAVAVRLAGLLDVGDPVMMTGAWARELRSTLLALAAGRSTDDDDGSSWLDSLPAPVRNAEES